MFSFVKHICAYTNVPEMHYFMKAVLGGDCRKMRGLLRLLTNVTEKSENGRLRFVTG